MITSQREIILDYLKSIASHPTADEIHSEVRKMLPRISKGTVYRNLKVLREEREIQEIFAGKSHYDGDTSSHAHFTCQKCNKVFDVFDICRKCSVLKRKTIKVGKIKYYQIHFYGLCKKCRKRYGILP